jgi:hypothetical protein
MQRDISSVEEGRLRQRKGMTGVPHENKLSEGVTQMLYADQYYYLMSLAGYEAMGFALILAVRSSEFLFESMSPAPVLSPAPVFASPGPLL